MSISAAVAMDPATGAPVLTVQTTPRGFTVTVTNALDGMTATASGQWPVSVQDSSGRTWTLVSDDGTTAVFH